MRPGESAGVAGFLAGSLAAGALIPLAPAQRLFPPLDLGLLIALGGFFSLALLLVAAVASNGPRRQVLQRLETATLWSACGLAALGAAGSVAASAESLNLEYIVLAQRHTSLFVLTQPAAASIYVVSLALAGQAPALRSVLGAPTPSRRAAELAALAALAALGATLFLGGFAGRGLPAPVWVMAKTIAVALLLVATRRWLRGLSPGARLAIAWAASLLAFVNLALTLALARR